jgi:hypothetical protein
MRLTILSLFFYAGTAAFCQLAATPGSPNKPVQNPPVFNWQGTDFSRIPPAWHRSNVTQPPIFELHKTDPVRIIDHTQIDPQMIVHPPKPSLGLQPQGTLVAQNEYPGLQFLPIGSATLQPIPITWPKLKLQAIPIVSPMLKLLPVDPQAPVATSAPRK